MRTAIQRANSQPMVPWAAGAAILAFLGTTAGQQFISRVAPDHGPTLERIERNLALLDQDVASLARASWRLGARGGSWTNRIEERLP